MDYQLVVLKGRSAAKTLRLADGVTTIGRQDGCELTVRSSQVSRKHCQLFEKKGLLLVKDLGSANGTFVNGKRIEEQRVLEPGDLLMVGPIEFRVESLGSAVTSGAEAQNVTVGSGSGAKSSDTAIPEPVEAPIALDDDDVLEFVIGGDEEQPQPSPAPAKSASPGKASTPESAPPATRPSPKPQASPAAKAPAAKQAKPKQEPKQDAVVEDAGANEAIAEFLMGIEIDDDDRR
ncbi:FHA domain-containing protein [Tautonia rosea]|uniref:FHA domain-containing protein n=1 Tax=Tautonia rosea TaxID=2728037 RepID=UPI0014767D42|nr:FHA domain-containing protein [Tautonia rosea]